MATTTEPQTQQQPGRQISVREQKFTQLRELLGRASSNLKMALPKHMTVERMVRIALTATSKNPRLFECTNDSIALALLNASETGLEPNGYEGHLVPYRNNRLDCYEAQFQPDYKGLIQLAYRHPSVISIDAEAVREADDFEYERGSKPFLRHIAADVEDRGQLKYAWASAQLHGGGFKFIVLNRSQVLEHRAKSKAYTDAVKYKKDKPGNGVVWIDHEEAMWIKTAVRMLTKFIPRSIELQNAVQLDDMAVMGRTQALDMGVLQAFGKEDDEPAAEQQPAITQSRSQALANGMKKPAKAKAKPVAPNDDPPQEQQLRTEDEYSQDAPDEGPHARERSLLDWARSAAEVGTSKAQVKAVEDALFGPDIEFELSEDGKQEAKAFIKAARDRIDSGRGQNSNKKAEQRDLIGDKQQSATEAGH